MKTNLTVEMVLITPEVASNYLRFNNKNRVVSNGNSIFLAKEMKANRFLENGESIVFDYNGDLKDGQHRLNAIVKSGKSYFIPVVRGVNPNVMATIDTGKNRSASDVLHLNGFKNANRLSTFVALINNYYYRKSKNKENKEGKVLSNQQVLDFCKENYEWLEEILKNVNNIYNKQNKPTIVNHSVLCLYAFILGGKNPSKEVYDFLNNLCGNIRVLDTAPNYLFNKLYNAKINKEPLNFYWVLGMTIKAYNYFVDGNPAVNYFRFSVEQELPNVTKL